MSNCDVEISAQNSDGQTQKLKSFFCANPKDNSTSLNQTNLVRQNNALGSNLQDANRENAILQQELVDRDTKNQQLLQIVNEANKNNQDLTRKNQVLSDLHNNYEKQMQKKESIKNELEEEKNNVGMLKKLFNWFSSKNKYTVGENNKDNDSNNVEKKLLDQLSAELNKKLQPTEINKNHSEGSEDNNNDSNNVEKELLDQLSAKLNEELKATEIKGDNSEGSKDKDNDSNNVEEKLLGELRAKPNEVNLNDINLDFKENNDYSNNTDNDNNSNNDNDNDSNNTDNKNSNSNKDMNNSTNTTYHKDSNHVVQYEEQIEERNEPDLDLKKVLLEQLKEKLNSNHQNNISGPIKNIPKPPNEKKKEDSPNKTMRIKRSVSTSNLNRTKKRNKDFEAKYDDTKNQNSKNKKGKNEGIQRSVSTSDLKNNS